MKTPAFVLAILASAACAWAAETVRLPATKDNSIVLVDKEWRENAGGQSRIRIKGNQHIVAMMFDVAAIKGKLVKSAVLVCQKGDANIEGLTISTIMCDWDEMKSNALTSGMQERSFWGYDGARFPAVCGGNSFSLVCQSRSEIVGAALRGRPDVAPADDTGQPRRVAPTKTAGEEYRWPVDPDLVHALATGTAYGLALHEWSADYSRNPTICSREQKGKEPYLEVTLSDDAEPVPEPPTELKVELRDKHDLSSVRLTLRAPKNGFAYEVTVGTETLSRWNTPLVRPGEVQVIPIRDLELKSRHAGLTISVTTLNRLGKRLAPTATKLPPIGFSGFGSTSEELPLAGWPPQGMCVIPLEDKYDAAGKPVGDLPPDYHARNEVFDGQTIRLAAARGEVVGFQALVKGSGKITVQCDLPGVRVEVYRALYVACEGGRRIPDPLVPLAPTEELALSADE
ncbi:MAG: hypothetical protein NT049_05210, partial [Planctomycetota bacterium]|nr:hypothetical protein [Planctomycetota bacterium]